MNVLIDTNIILDVILQREPWFREAAEVWAFCESGILNGCVQASVITDIFYIVRRAKNIPGALDAVDACLRVFTILPVDRSILEQARQLRGTDFEDNVQIACALAATLEAVVTRDPAGYTNAPIQAITPHDLLASI
jgi:predicted nucleic acid-binding protein